jgi:SNF2 family DNA or RNA helicase
VILRPYQEQAVQAFLSRGDLLLAMTMGSGKTAVAIESVRTLREADEVQSGTVFALNSTKFQWVREIAKWDPGARSMVIEGNKSWRTTQYRHAARNHYVILHYECLVNDWDLIQRFLPIDFVILDEATAIKGFKAKRSKRAKALGRYTPYRMALSGQPVENRPEELFSIMEFTNRSVLGSFWKFDRTFIERDHWGKPKRYRNLNLLHQRLDGAMFRRSREDIAEWLPEMTEMECPIRLDSASMALHDFVRDDLLAAIDKALAAGVGAHFDVISHYGRNESAQVRTLMGNVMSRMLAMRMLASHPLLLRYSASEFDDETTKRGSQYASQLKVAGVLDGITERCAKLDSLIETVVEILDEDPTHKVVIFSYFKPMLRLIGKRLSALKISGTTLTGDVKSAKERDERIVRFNTDPACRVFLSSDAGAYGVDLNHGSHLICYDLPWSAGSMQQRVSRIDRTSSAFDKIIIMYFFGQRTIEERMYAMLMQKKKISGAFVDGKYDSKTGTLALDLQSLRSFLEAA